MYPLVQRVLLHLRERALFWVETKNHIFARTLFSGQRLVGIDQGLRRALFEGFAVVPKRHESSKGTKFTTVKALPQIDKVCLIERVAPGLKSPRQHTGDATYSHRCLIGHSIGQGGVQPRPASWRDAGKGRLPVD